MKYCKDCKWFNPGEFGDGWCERTYITEHDLVWGPREHVELCREARKDTGECGPMGTWWKEKQC